MTKISKQFFVDLTQVQPLDIVLTAGTGLSSYFIRAVTSVKGRRKAKYSHAALFLSPSLLVEALTLEGIVCSDLVFPGQYSNSHAKANPAMSRSVHFRRQGDRLAVFAHLPGVVEAGIYRHHALKSSEIDSSTLSFLRDEALKVLVETYLRQYTGLGRLPKAIVRLPIQIEQFVERAASLIDRKKPEPGPFCSELVCELLNSQLNSELPNPERVAPSDLSWSPDSFESVPAIKVVGSPDSLPGEPCLEGFAEDLSRLLVSVNPTIQELRSKTLQILSVISPFAADQNTTKSRLEWEQHFAKRRAELRAQWVDELGMTLNFGADRFWEWVHSSNACIDDCPRRRREQLDLVKQHFKPAKASLDPIASIFRGSFRSEWDGRRCIDTSECVMCEPRLSSVKESISLLNTHRRSVIAVPKGDAPEITIRDA